MVETKPIRILHILTLSGEHGEYGGPNRVASELCRELRNQGHSSQIVSGIKLTSESTRGDYSGQSFIPVKPLSKRYPVSSLWSRKFVKNVYPLIKESDIVHIHFARDLIPMVAALICIIQKRPFVTQTHGMVIPDGRKLTKVLDKFLTRPLLNQSKINFVLTNQEFNLMKSLNLRCRMELLSNGIEVSNHAPTRNSESRFKVIFCSRLHARKRPDRFIQLALEAERVGIKADFDIYGPDGGELSSILKSISESNLPNLTYRGALPPESVQEWISEYDLLVLPSENEPFPMVALESLSMGTPILIMPSCGIAGLIRETHSELVSRSEDLQGLKDAFLNLYAQGVSSSYRKILQEFCRSQFSIGSVTLKITKYYESILNSEI